MSSHSNDYGRAYEYAWILSLSDKLSDIRPTIVAENSSLDANREAWNSVSQSQKDSYLVSANSALDTILELEPLLSEGTDTLKLSAQSDDAGKIGDVRDIVLSRKSANWEVGLSLKHNHNAVKHSRLSRSLDFGKKWYGEPCSDNYFSNISQVFDDLELYKSNHLKWSEINNKDDAIYQPILEAFIEEVKRAYTVDRNIAKRMVEYLIGIYDFYKVVSQDKARLTVVYSYNLHGTLNQKGVKKVSAITVPIVDLPTRIVAIEFKPESKTTVELYLDNGWQFNFRLHNASTYVESSLKFDISLVGSPSSVMHIECKWRKS